MSRALLGLALWLALSSCASCPPAWLDALPQDPDYLYARASVGRLGLPISAERVALGRATRDMAAQLGWQLTRVSATRVGEGLVVEAAGPDGLRPELEALELVSSTSCGGRYHVLVRLARPGG